VGGNDDHCPILDIHYKASFDSGLEHIALQKVLVFTIEWCIQANWVSPLSLHYTLNNWYPKYEDADVPMVLVNYRDNFLKESVTNTPGNKPQPTALTAILICKLNLKQSEVDLVLDIYNGWSSLECNSCIADRTFTRLLIY
jgi:hypothetical protein